MITILLPTDFSKNSVNAISYATAFFSKQPVHFYVLNIQKSSEYATGEMMAASSDDSIYTAILNDNKKQLDQLVKRLKKNCKAEQYTFTAIIDFDDFIPGIQQAVERFAIQLIIMGTNGATGAKEVIFGSNTLKVMRNVNFPLITVPEWCVFSELKSIVFTTSYTAANSSTDISILKKIQSIHGSELSILEINDDVIELLPAKESKEIKDVFKAIPHAFYALNGIPTTTAISAFVQLMKIDLVVFVMEKESFVERLFLGSEFSKINYATRIPLLVLHTE